ncbi:MAG: SCO family protein [Gammaproteobacteria bacterium]
MIIDNLANFLRPPLFLAAFAVLFLLASAPTWAAPKGNPWGEDYFPNVELTDQEGHTLRFYDDLIKDKIVAINFIFTHCSDSCPLETASLRRVFRLLGEHMGKDIFFYSISIDPEHDTPEALKEYAQRFKIGSDSGWRFLTGKEADITLLRKKLGLFRSDADAENLSDHNTSFIIGNDNTGQWLKRTPFDEPGMLAWLLKRSIKRGKSPESQTLTAYASAEKIPQRRKGEELYRSRCNSCHSLDTEDRLGPGLQGVTERRDKDWLARWLKTPDRMLSENDPIATALFNQYQQLPMPNLRLSDSDVQALIAYMEKLKD